VEGSSKGLALLLLPNLIFVLAIPLEIRRSSSKQHAKQEEMPDKQECNKE